VGLLALAQGRPGTVLIDLPQALHRQPGYGVRNSLSKLPLSRFEMVTHGVRRRQRVVSVDRFNEAAMLRDHGSSDSPRAAALMWPDCGTPPCTREGSCASVGGICG
jgi:hypothetical protein